MKLKFYNKSIEFENDNRKQCLTYSRFIQHDFLDWKWIHCRQYQTR